MLNPAMAMAGHTRLYPCAEISYFRFLTSRVIRRPARIVAPRSSGRRGRFLRHSGQRQSAEDPV